MLTSQWRSIIETFNNNAIVPEQEWDDNTEANISRLHKSNSVWRLERSFVAPNDKAVILVGASPCLKTDVEKLKQCNDEFRIFCVNSALKYLLENNIKPHFVVTVDSDDTDIYDHLDVDSKNLTLIASTSSSPRVLDNWKGKIWYLPYFGMKKKFHSKIKARAGKAIPVGGNTLNTTVAMCIKIFGARIIILVAAECCYDKHYYVSKNIVRNNVKATEFITYDVDGNQRVTTTALHTYKLWLEKLAIHVSPHVKIIDTSMGILGKREDKSKIYVYELSEILNKVKEAASKKKEIIKDASIALLNAKLHPQTGERMQGGTC